MKISEANQTNALIALKINASSPSEEETPENETAPSVRKRDEYIPGDNDDEPIGLYRMEYDDEGSPSVNYDAPNNKKPEQEKSEKCTANTDEVDRELESLKEKQRQLETQIKSADNDKKAEQLRKQLAAVQRELALKDNDAYRRSRTVFS